MDKDEFYEQKPVSFRSLDEGIGIKNSHNFVKAVLIKRFVLEKTRILDLGCGQGGDLIKIKYTNPSFYVGIDSSHKAIAAAQRRSSNIKMRCRCHFYVIDFTKHDWMIDNKFDVINSQFSIHFAFETKEKTNFTMKNIYHHLSDNGLFIGTIPIHPGYSTSDEVVVKLPGDERFCKEYAVETNDFIQALEQHGFQLILLESFDLFHEKAKQSENDLFIKMKADCSPDKNNFVFCFQKLHQI